MRMKTTHVIATAQWLIDPAGVLRELSTALDIAIEAGDTTTGCFVVSFDGPMGPEEVERTA